VHAANAQETTPTMVLVGIFVGNRITVSTTSSIGVGEKIERAISDILKRLSHEWTFDFAEIVCSLDERGELTFIELSPRLRISNSLPLFRSFATEAFKGFLRERWDQEIGSPFVVT
jgi:hypothetical protein